MVHEKSQFRGFQKTYVGRLFSGYLKYPLSRGFLRVLGVWMTFKKADMAKTLKTRFSMIETNPLNHKWLDFVILTGLTLHQFQTNWLLRPLFWLYMCRPVASGGAGGARAPPLFGRSANPISTRGGT